MVNWTEDAHGMRGGQVYAHIPPQPFWMLILRFVQGFLALLNLILAAVGTSVFAGYSGYGMTIFTAIATWLFLAYISTARFAPNAYNVWAQLALEIIITIFWLASFALLAQLASVLGIFDYDYYYDSSKVSAAVGCTKGGAAMGAFEWLAFVATLIGFGIQVSRMRAGGALSTGMAQGGQEHKMNAVPVQQQPVYGQQPPAGQQYQPAVQQQYQQQNMA